MSYSFIEIGSNTVPSPSVQSFIDAGKSGIFIDAMPRCLEVLRFKLENKHSTIKHLYIAGVINTFNGFCEFFWPQTDDMSQHSSVSKNHLEKHRHNTINQMFTVCFTLDFLVNRLNLEGEHKEHNIELLSVDTEGLDCDILLSTDFTLFRPNTIYFEHIHSEAPFKGRGEKFNKTIKYLESFGYKEKWADGSNIELYIP